MTNALLDPNRWKGNTSPPASWNGTSYDWVGADLGEFDVLYISSQSNSPYPNTLNSNTLQENTFHPNSFPIFSTILDGDIVAFRLDVITPTEVEDYCTVQLNNADGLNTIFSQDVSKKGTYNFTTAPLSEGDIVHIYAAQNRISTAEIKITPTPDVVPTFWKDLTGPIVRTS